MWRCLISSSQNTRFICPIGSFHRQTTIAKSFGDNSCRQFNWRQKQPLQHVTNSPNELAVEYYFCNYFLRAFIFVILLKKVGYCFLKYQYLLPPVLWGNLPPVQNRWCFKKGDFCSYSIFCFFQDNIFLPNVMSDCLLVVVLERTINNQLGQTMSNIDLLTLLVFYVHRDKMTINLNPREYINVWHDNLGY